MSGILRTSEQDHHPEPWRLLKIDCIELFPAHYPVASYFKFVAAARGPVGRPTIIVKIAAQDGTVGWGDCLPMSAWSDETLETAVVALRRYLIPPLIGHDAADLRRGAPPAG